MEGGIMFRLIIFGCFGLLVFLKFRSELRRPESHGFYMFFAFEALLVLGYLNIQLSGTFNGLRILSVILLVCSGLMAFSGFYGLKRYGRPGKDWEDTTRLIQQGIFRWIRHPLYTSLMLLALGLLLNHLSFGAVSAFGVAFVFLFSASRIEEKENMEKFGDDYLSYQRKTKRYLPFLI